jgi:23S rRNA maturation-related 3'-5' exoribonuclease YhaM
MAWKNGIAQEPMFPEAIIIHHLDNLDAKVKRREGAI